jgi:hypothetical protein
MSAFEGVRPFCVGLVHRVKNCRSRNVSSGGWLSLEIRKTDLVSISDELLRNLDELLDLVRHIGWVEEVVG